MNSDKPTIEELITTVLIDIQQECFIYTDGVSKFIIHPNYKMKVSREHVKLVNFITATRIKDPMEFTLPKYKKIETTATLEK